MSEKVLAAGTSMFRGRIRHGLTTPFARAAGTMIAAIAMVALLVSAGCSSSSHHASGPEGTVDDQASGAAHTPGQGAGHEAGAPASMQEGGHAGMKMGSASKTGSAQVPLFDNLGALSHPITTSSPQAQRYFDQGLNLMYGFNVEEAQRAFEEAARLDPNCAMAWWGVALSLGSDINVPRMPDREKEADKAARKAVSLAAQASDAEKGYIAAIATRYSSDPKADGKALDEAYAAAMREAHQKNPNDLDAATLYAASLMDLRPWKFWTPDGKPAEGTMEIIALLESVLKANPDHPGANHFYIHMIEASPHPEQALESAKRLPRLVPGAGHLVHMPFHIYMRTGRYAEAAEANKEAVETDKSYIEKYNPVGFYSMMYYPHNIQSRWASLAMLGQADEALAAAQDLARAVPPTIIRQMPMSEFFTPTLMFHYLRFGLWDEALAEAAPPPDLLYWTACWHYARGVAFARKASLDDAAREQAAFVEAVKKVPPDTAESLNSAGDLFKVAAAVLDGEIALGKGDRAGAIRAFQEAVKVQDALQYDEPPPWYYSVRESLGAVLLAAGRADEAEAVYRKDLEILPENGWALAGLARSLRAQRRETEAAAIETRLRKAWPHADPSLMNASSG